MTRVISFEEFDNSLNFMFGVTRLPEVFDVLHNPYFEYIGYELADILTLEQKYEFELCSQKFVDGFVARKAQGWYD